MYVPKVQNKNKPVKNVLNLFQSLPRSLQRRIVNKSSNIIKYLSEDGDHS